VIGKLEGLPQMNADDRRSGKPKQKSTTEARRREEEQKQNPLPQMNADWKQHG
jgi:hypothetical protein